MAIIDVVTYNGEQELFEIRYNILKDFVDEFRVIEFDRTFSGKPKEKKFNKNWDKVKHYFLTEDTWRKYKNLAWQSPNTLGAEHWKREFMQKESIKDCLTDLDDEDIIMLGDVDELPDMPKMISQPRKLKLRVYTYWLNNRSSEEFWGTLVSRWRYLKNECLNHLRSDVSLRTKEYFGWHFTSLASYLKQKLQDSYTKETYATEQVLSNLSNNIKENKDFLGRNFTYRIDESEWPQWLQEH